MKKQDMKISVIMSTYNESRDDLKEAIESILNQSYSLIEFIIVIDNPNNLELVDMIRYYEQLDTRIKVILNEKNLGLVASLNKAIKQASGDYIARMDADDVSLKNRLENQFNYALKFNIDILGGNTLVIDEQGKNISKMINIPVGYEKIKKLMMFNNCIAHPTWFVKKKVYIELKGYRHIHACEDYDFLLRALNKGYKIDNLKEPVLKYRMTQNSISRSNGLRQFLTSRYLIANFKKLDEVTQENIEKKLDHISQEDEKKYALANTYLMNAMQLVETKCYFKGIKNIILAFVTSKFYRKKMINLFICQIRG